MKKRILLLEELPAIATLIVASYILVISFQPQIEVTALLRGLAAALLFLAVTLGVQRATTLRRIEQLVTISKPVPEVEKFLVDVKQAPSLESYIEKAKREIFLIGPTRSSLIRKLHKDALIKKSKQCAVKILIMKNFAPDVLPLLRPLEKKAVTDLEAELKSAHSEFPRWRDEAKRKNGNFSVKVYPLISFTVNFVDGSESNGEALIILHRYTSSIRPSFQLSRKNQPELFEALYSYYSGVWQDEAEEL